ncbi:hypothetical protein HanXRQr2_Chr03g0099681 [Helianthus annuus]|uniref:Uncharacterized protein n=1 Tax=Helianthus annuus TaxID=4232 RepID=A0A9K3JF85_HELAN|nr:hypothetical protein HanXRQr2_Chr03g0099681 [Helianthus annuus]KAJ0942763.1 hypothetical protein HanPSC8_Chr03g0096001 [Helianthus annuus]
MLGLMVVAKETRFTRYVRVVLQWHVWDNLGIWINYTFRPLFLYQITMDSL